MHQLCTICVRLCRRRSYARHFYNYSYCCCTNNDRDQLYNIDFNQPPNCLHRIRPLIHSNQHHLNYNYPQSSHHSRRNVHGNGLCPICSIRQHTRRPRVQRRQLRRTSWMEPRWKRRLLQLHRHRRSMRSLRRPIHRDILEQLWTHRAEIQQCPRLYQTVSNTNLRKACIRQSCKLLLLRHLSATWQLLVCW